MELFRIFFLLFLSRISKVSGVVRMSLNKKILSSDLMLYFRKNFPFQNNLKKSKKYEVCLGIGGNIGNMFKRFDSLLKGFKNDTRIFLKETSPILENPPFGYLEQDYFLNGIIEITTDLHPTYLLKIMQKYEKRFDRKRTFQDAPRTLDIDIIFIKKYNKDIQVNKKELTVPHIGWQDRDSVKIPILYMKNKNSKKYKV
jgi:2-amino-4-hydroxy-6-hydroxymethyldihydropteridine diphosphokinase